METEPKEERLEDDEMVQGFMAWMDENITAWMLLKEQLEGVTQAIHKYRIHPQVVYAQLKILILTMQLSVENSMTPKQLKTHRKLVREMDGTLHKIAVQLFKDREEGTVGMQQFLMDLLNGAKQKEKEAQGAYR